MEEPVYLKHIVQITFFADEEWQSFHQFFHEESNYIHRVRESQPSIFRKRQLFLHLHCFEDWLQRLEISLFREIDTFLHTGTQRSLSGDKSFEPIMKVLTPWVTQIDPHESRNKSKTGFFLQIGEHFQFLQVRLGHCSESILEACIVFLLCPCGYDFKEKRPVLFLDFQTPQKVPTVQNVIRL